MVAQQALNLSVGVQLSSPVPIISKKGVLNMKIKRFCRDCGKEFELTEKQKEGYLKKNMPLPTRCITCRAKNRQYITKQCLDCKLPFQISVLNCEWYARHGLKEPERCPECRQKRKQKKQQKKAGVANA